MYNIKIPISVFRALQKIADNYNVQYREWADKSGVQNTRISEYSKIAELYKSSTELPERLRKRAFTINTAINLYSALKKIVGEERMKKDMLKCVDAETDPLVKIILMAVVKHEEGDKKFIKMAAEYLELLFKANSK